MACRDLRTTLKELIGSSKEPSAEQLADAKIQQILLEIAQTTGLAEVEGFLPNLIAQEDRTVIVYDKFATRPRQ